MFGIAPETCQHIIQQLLQGCEGARNIADDIVIHGPTVEVHDERLLKVMETLRGNVSCWILTKVCFMSLESSLWLMFCLKGGIGLTEEKTREEGRNKGTWISCQSKTFSRTNELLWSFHTWLSHNSWAFALICTHNRTHDKCFGFQYRLERFQTVFYCF